MSAHCWANHIAIKMFRNDILFPGKSISSLAQWGFQLSLEEQRCLRRWEKMAQPEKFRKVPGFWLWKHWFQHITLCMYERDDTAALFWWSVSSLSHSVHFLVVYYDLRSLSYILISTQVSSGLMDTWTDNSLTWCTTIGQTLEIISYKL